MTYHHDANQNSSKVEFLRWFQFNKIVPKSILCACHFSNQYIIFGLYLIQINNSIIYLIYVGHIL